MAGKLILSWDIARDREREYFEFVVREFIPGVQRLGLELTDAWATAYGDQPQIMVGAVGSSIEEVKSVLDSTEWLTLSDQLQEYVRNYNEKVVNSTGGFQF